MQARVMIFSPFVLFLSLISGSPLDHELTPNNEGYQADYIYEYSRNSLSVIITGRLAPHVFEPFLISEYFKFLFAVQPSITSQGMQILIQAITEMEESLEAETLKMAERVFIPSFEFTNNRMAICINQSFSNHYYASFPPELEGIKRSKIWSMALFNWVQFNETLAHASPTLRDGYAKVITSQDPVRILEERLRRLEDNIERIWTIDHLYSWGNVVASYYYCEYLRLTLLISGDVFDCPVKKGQWLRLKILFEMFQRGNLIVPKGCLIVDELLVPPRYYGSVHKISKEQFPGCTVALRLFVYKLPCAGISFLHMVTIRNAVIIYYSHHLKERNNIKEYVRESRLDDELVEYVHQIIKLSS